MTKLSSEYADRFPELSLAWQTSGVNSPEIVWVNDALAQELGIDVPWLHTPEGTRWLIGEHLAAGSKPVAQVYAGHQFGHYSPRLGDGRALLLGEIRNKNGDLLDLHLKGSGPTPFSRGGDGYAALGPMLREAIMGEAMHALGVKTSRALAVVKTGRWVARDGEPFPAAILTRVASSHIRVGTFEFVRRRGDIDELQKLAEYVLKRHYPERHLKVTQEKVAPEADGPGFAAKISRELLRAVVEAQAELIASWMLIGFVHGVINTDNVTIAGETIDYGPCAMMDYFDPAIVFSSIDHAGRYAYRNQPGVMQWNMARFAEALLPLLAEEQEQAVRIAEEEVQKFNSIYERVYEAGLAKKLGDAGTESLEVLQTEKPDFTQFFRELSEKNPIYIPRNHIVQEAIEAAEDDDFAPLKQLMLVVSDPYTEKPGYERYAQPAPPEAGHFITTCGT